MPAAWDRRSASEQARVEELALADWLPGATTFAPHWAQQAQRLGLEPTELVTKGSLLRFPPSLQGDVSARGGASMVQRPTESQVKAVASGSLLVRIARSIRDDQRAGKRTALLEEFKPVHVTRGGVAGELAIASSRADLDRMHRVGARAASLLGLGDHDYLVSAVPAGPDAAFWSVHAMALGSSMLALHPRGHGDGLDRCIEAFGLLPATVVACPTLDAVAWARQLAEADADVSRVIMVVLVGPPPTDEERAAVLDAWRAAGATQSELAVRAMWTPDVHRGIWTECAEGTEGLHTSPDLELLETVDALTGRTSQGSGDLTITSLGWSGTTLLRYRTGHRVDGLSTADSPCPACGRTVPRITGQVRTEAWQPRLRRAEGLATLDLRALAIELDATPSSAWRVSLQRRGNVDGYVIELGGELSRHQLADVEERCGRAAGIEPERALAADADIVRSRVELLGSPFADNR